MSKFFIKDNSKDKYFNQNFFFLFRISNNLSFKAKCFSDEVQKGKLMDYGGNARPLFIKKIFDVLKRGCGDRVEELYLKPLSDTEVNISYLFQYSSYNIT